VPSSSWFSFLRKTRPPALIFDVFDDFLPLLHEKGRSVASTGASEMVSGASETATGASEIVTGASPASTEASEIATGASAEAAASLPRPATFPNIGQAQALFFQALDGARRATSTFSPAFSGPWKIPRGFFRASESQQGRREDGKKTRSKSW
jgi:hypothetical protein